MGERDGSDSGKSNQEIKEWFSHGHLGTAEFFKDCAKLLEQDEFEDPFESIVEGEPIEVRHRIFVIYSIIASNAFLEARINEFHDAALDAVEHWPYHYDQEMGYGPVDDGRFMRLVKNLNQVEQRDFSYKPTLKKYQVILTYADEETFDPGQNPYQDVKLVRELRNYFVHYQPEWRGIGTDQDTHRLESGLQGKYQQNPLAGEDALLFPDKLLSADSARWARESCQEFVSEFLERINGRETHTFRKMRTRGPDGPLSVNSVKSAGFYSEDSTSDSN
ncbi:hypothetical protein [Natronobacterium lacisalsi]|uniref:hypothetical protein n=1 Tax=Natronobacterium lacisalsi TaxID=229731 RepID=UPI0012683122|nr:hypothetical protein [Halobiforma lacisalsi]